MNLDENIREFIVLLLQLFCNLEILPNAKVKKWEQGEEAAKEKSTGREGRIPAAERRRESRKAAKALGRWGGAAEEQSGESWGGC